MIADWNLRQITWLILHGLDSNWCLMIHLWFISKPLLWYNDGITWRVMRDLTRLHSWGVCHSTKLPTQPMGSLPQPCPQAGSQIPAEQQQRDHEGSPLSCSLFFLKSRWAWCKEQSHSATFSWVLLSQFLFFNKQLLWQPYCCSSLLTSYLF